MEPDFATSMALAQEMEDREAAVAMASGCKFPDAVGLPTECPHQDLRNRVVQVLRHDAVQNFQDWHPVVRTEYDEAPETLIEKYSIYALNTLRSKWAVGPYSDASLVTSTGGFPDITIMSQGQRVLGIEIKAWDAFCKEGAPTFRFKASPLACAEQDILVVYTYFWDYIFPRRGKPVLVAPWVASSRSVAEFRNAQWVVNNPSFPLQPVSGATPNPRSVREEINDSAKGDKGGDFGRIGRLSIMAEYLQETYDYTYAPEKDLKRHNLRTWRTFLRG